MTYHFLLAWNSEKLEFVGIHPETKLHWKGVMRKMEDGKWEVDQTPGDHDLHYTNHDLLETDPLPISHLPSFSYLLSNALLSPDEFQQTATCPNSKQAVIDKS
ncbi:hypothetical protein GCK72_007144 [Caenorhabditis remanei]|uniref:Uncharacterized protein n=1 Tax=Caenorhabditis remanei TaxID=31234 RepID=A0A6A5HIB2_CAERE|nr:hypothetical protein GCK72_007144 [Caenorhabditis remanei]KAF1767185.1 hypothetical protein GCK72_007144 [Caenorhabditis remanei]